MDEKTTLMAKRNLVSCKKSLKKAAETKWVMGKLSEWVFII
jgi:hypothetical protein